MEKQKMGDNKDNTDKQQQQPQQTTTSIKIQKQPIVAQNRPLDELDKTIQILLIKADSKFNLGKFAECLIDFEQAEQIAAQMNDKRLVSR